MMMIIGDDSDWDDNPDHHQSASRLASRAVYVKLAGRIAAASRAHETGKHLNKRPHGFLKKQVPPLYAGAEILKHRKTVHKEIVTNAIY